jgi:hypothetical protein
MMEHDFIMLDEAQDTNAAVIYALSKQSGKTVYVGDKYQQIYGFRGAFNAMERITLIEGLTVNRKVISYDINPIASFVQYAQTLEVEPNRVQTYDVSLKG